MDYLLQGFITAIELLTMGHEETYSAIGVTLEVTSLAMGVSLILGIPLGFALGHFHFRGKRVCRLVVDTLLSFPTVVIGLLVYSFLSSKGPLGDLSLLFTIAGMAIGLVILALPIVVALTAAAIEGLGVKLKPTLLALGASGWQVAKTSLWEGRFAVSLAGVSAFGRVISEVGIAMMVGGNIKWHTRTITTAIALETNKGEFAMGIALGLVLMIIALAVNLAMVSLRGRAR